MEKTQNDDPEIQSIGTPTAQPLPKDSSSGDKVENDDRQHDLDPISTRLSAPQEFPEGNWSARNCTEMNSMTSTLLDPRATPMPGSLTGSKLSLTTLTTDTATPSQISDSGNDAERPSQAGNSAVDPENPSTKTLIPSTATFDYASIPIHATQTPPQTAGHPSQTGEKTRQVIFNLFKKGPPATSLEVPLEPWRMALVNIALLLAGFMVGLDQSIIGPAIPTIVSQFHSIHDIGAYQSAYLLPQCVLQPMCNKLYSVTSFSTTYISSVVIFGVGGLICATSQNSSALICGRAVSGIGAVGLSLGGFRLLAMLPESKRQNLSMGFFSLFLGCSVVVGPIAGGTITSTLNWHWIFWINLPVMGVVLLCVLLVTFMNGPDLQGEHAQKPVAQKLQLLGWLGTVLFILTLTPFILALQFAAEHGWASPSSIAMWVLAGVSFIAFVIQQKQSSNKIFDPVIALNRSVWPTCGLFFSALSTVAVLVLFLPFLLQLVKGVSPRQSGVESFPLAVTITVGTLIFSAASTIVPFFNPFSILGTTLLVGACIMFVTLRSDFTIPRLIGYELIAGFGVGMAWLSEIIFPRAVLDKYQLATSLGYSRMLQQTGATMSVQIATIIFTTRLKKELSFLGKKADDISGLLGDLGAGVQIPAEAIPLVIRAYSLSIRAGLYVALVFACLSLAFAIVLPWPRLKGGITDHSRSGELESCDGGTELVAS